MKQDFLMSFIVRYCIFIGSMCAENRMPCLATRPGSVVEISLLWLANFSGVQEFDGHKNVQPYDWNDR